MTLADRPTPDLSSNAPRPAKTEASAPIERPSSLERVLRFFFPARRAAAERHARMLEIAKQNPPPQRWHDEDFSTLRTPPRT